MSASVIQKNGAPRLVIGGKYKLPALYALSDFPAASADSAYARRNIAAFGRAGISLVSADTGIHIGWRKTTPYETEAMHEEIAAVLDANPDAQINIRLHVNPPYWWMRDNPDECIIYRTEAGDAPGIDDGESDRLIRNDMAGHMRVSLASEKWKKEAGEKVARFCDELSSSANGKHVFAVQIACGANGEWHQWGTDVGKPMRERFRRFLLEKYGTDDALRKAWNDPCVTIESAEFHPEIFRAADDGAFRNPKYSRATMDAQRCNQESVVSAILYFCDIVKAHFPGVLTGAFYGYQTGVYEERRPIGGHIAMDMIYKAHEEGRIDFLCGPFCYMENRNSDGVPMQRALLESNRLHGMLWLTEMDEAPVGTENFVGGDPDATDETIAVLRRNIFQPLLAGEGFWYYDHRLIPRYVPADSKNPSAGSIYRKHGWWERDVLMEEIAHLQDFSEKHMLCRYTPAADVLLVFGMNSFYCRAKVSDAEYTFHESVARYGAAYDCIYDFDLPRAELSRYKCVIFFNVCELTPEKRAEARRLLQGIRTIWLYASGFSDGETLSEKNISETVGMEIVRTEPKKKIIWNGGAEIDVNEQVCDPVFTLSGAENAEILARYEDGSVAAAKKGNDVWCGVPRFTPDIMKTLLLDAGVHRYCDSGEPVLAGYGLVALCCARGGERTLVFKNGKRTTEVLPPWTTAVYDAESGKRLI